MRLVGLWWQDFLGKVEEVMSGRLWCSASSLFPQSADLTILLDFQSIGSLLLSCLFLSPPPLYSSK